MSQPIDFTIKKIEALPAAKPGTRDVYKDTKTPGLFLRVTAQGVKTFCFYGRPKGGAKAERETLGKFPAYKPEEARAKAREIGGHLAAGKSFAAARRERRGEMTVRELWTEYFAVISKTNRAPEATEQVWHYYVEPVWAKRRLSEVSAMEVERWHLGLPEKIVQRRKEEAAARTAQLLARRAEVAAKQAIRRHGPDPKPLVERGEKAAKPVTGHGSANKALELLRAMFNFAMDQKRKLFAGPNPAAGHQKFKLIDRERFVRPDEMGRFFEAVAQEPNEAMRDAILLSLLTAQRRANIVAMKWSELNLDRAEWQLSAEFMKNGEPHLVPLTPEAVGILRNRQEKAALDAAARRGRSKADQAESTSAQFVFPSERSETGHITDFSSAWRRLVERADLKNLIPHDLRRTNGSWQARAGASLLVIGKSLNHKSPEATAIYARLDLDPVRQSVESATAAMFEAAGVKTAAKVISLAPAKASRKKSGGAR